MNIAGLGLAVLTLVAGGANADSDVFVPNSSLRAILKLEAPAQAQFDALPSHAKSLFNDAAANGLLGSTEQITAFLSLNLAADRLELLLQDNCVLCHTNPDNQEARTLFSIDPAQHGSAEQMNLSSFAADTHLSQGLSCSGCHGGAPTDTDMVPAIYARWPKAEVRASSRTWIPEFCARCHADPAFMRQHNPALPTDQLAKYATSRHGELLLVQKDSKAAQCTSCHGVHNIQRPENRGSWVHPQKIPFTCAKCHSDAQYMAGYKMSDGKALPTNQFADYRDSVHGKALLERGDLGAPRCNSCHGNHAAMPPQIASIAQVCRTCHVANGALFDGSKHKLAFRQHDWPECSQCHGHHAVQKPQDSWIGDTPGTLCEGCHSTFARQNATCSATSAAFRTTINELAAGVARYTPKAVAVAEDGLDAEPLAQSVAELEDSLRQSRSRIHAFDLSDFQQAAAPGLAAMTKADELVKAADAEFSFRRKGLAVAIAIMVYLAVILYLKIRQVDRN